MLRSANGNHIDNLYFFAAKLGMRVSEKLKKASAQVGLVKKFV
jgi:hypothetical protein